MAEFISNGRVKTAEEMAKEQREISISEFFEKNRHLLGFDSKIRAMLIIVKEGVDNALDACEEARILPDIYVKVEELEKEKYKIVIRDNGPGIVKKQIANIFGKLLYGSKFHKLKQSRGQQGLGISVCVLYSQLTSGQPTEVLSSTGDGKTHKYKLKIDVKQNRPIILSEEVTEDLEPWHGVQITFICEGLYREHKQSVLEYLKETAISNPYANITFDSPSGRYEFKRGIEKLPKEPKEIKPHLYGVEIGMMARMLRSTKAHSVSGFLVKEFTRVGSGTAKEICEKAGVDPRTSPRRISDEDIVKIVKAVKEVKLTRPPTDCLSPLGAEAIEEGLRKELNPEFIATVTRSPTVYRGWPFQVEASIAYGGSITDPMIMRFANRVPLLYQQGDCALTKAAQSIEWKRYHLNGDKLPDGPVAIFIHIASVWVPFTSESKEAVASYPVIMKEVKLALQEAARKVSIYLSGLRRAQYQAERLKTFEKYAGETAQALNELTGIPAERILEHIKAIINKGRKEMVTQEGDENGEERREGEAEGEADRAGE